MTALSAGMTREQAAELLAAHNKDPFHIEHGETVEQTMRYFAREYDPENEEFWGIVGLLHDLDWEEHDDEPEKHTLYAAPLIEEAGGTPELIRAIQSHTSDYNTDLPKPELQMEKILFATEELTGLIGAAIVMRPSKSVMDFNVKSLKTKYKDKRFAAGVSREVIASGADMLGWELDELFARTIEPPRLRRAASQCFRIIVLWGRFRCQTGAAFSIATTLQRIGGGRLAGLQWKADLIRLPVARRGAGADARSRKDAHVVQEDPRRL